jgi:peptidoglycan/LPS O-acetylase OafA/YrhL
MTAGDPAGPSDDPMTVATAQTSATLAPDVTLPRVALRRPRRRARVAAPAGLALLLAGGALLVRVAVLTAAGHGAAEHTWLFTAAACVLAGLALVVVALPRLAPPEDGEADEPEPGLPRG